MYLVVFLVLVTVMQVQTIVALAKDMSTNVDIVAAILMMITIK